MLRGLSGTRPLRHHSQGMLLVVITILLAMGGNRSLPPLGRAGEGAAEAAVSIEMVTDPPREQTLPDSRPAQLTFKASVDGHPLDSGRLLVDVTAPATPMLLPSLLPAVEGTTLLQLSSELTDGKFAVEYLFPIPGVYSFDFDIAPSPEGTTIESTQIRHSLHVQADPASVRRAWLFRGALFALGGIVGAWYVCAAHRQRTPPSRTVIGPGVIVLGGLVFITAHYTFADHGPRELVFPKGAQMIQGDDGWALEVRPTPEQAVVGELLDMGVTLTHHGQVFAAATEVAVHLYNLKDDQTVLRTSILAPNGSTSQRFQVVEGVPHTCTVTAHPASRVSEAPATLTAVVGIDAVAGPIPFSVRLRVMGLVLGMVGVGVAGGLILASGVRKLAGRGER
jgi:hypothetical protein